MFFGNPVKGRIGRVGHPDPASRFVVTRAFNDGSFPQFGPHDGLDIDNGNPPGDPILAIADGKVTVVRTDDNGARIVRIKHADGYSSGYAHLETVLVKVNDPVVRGQQVGTLGGTGFVTAPHLHFDITLDDRRRDPWPLLSQNGKEAWVPLILRERFERCTVPAGTPFFTDGPGVGTQKRFLAEAKLQTVAESTDGNWRLLRYQDSASAPRELLYVRTSRIRPQTPRDAAYDTRVVSALQSG